MAGTARLGYAAQRDRLLVAQALSEGLVVVTRDRLFAAYCVALVEA
jgi:PIN domain nuclease of toxin-antitoxin system